MLHRRTLPGLLLLGALYLPLMACQLLPASWQPTGLTRRGERVPLIAPRDLVSRLQAGEKIVLLDVREPQEFEENHLPGAINIPQRDFERRIAEIDREALIIPYCNMDFRGFYAVEELRNLGFEKIMLMERRGINGWRDLGLPIAGDETSETDTEAWSRLERFDLASLPARTISDPVPPNGRVRHVRINAANWYFNPNDLTVDAGDTVHLILESQAGTHYFVQPDFEIGVEIHEDEATEVIFVAGISGEFKFGSCEWDGKDLQVMKGVLRVRRADR